jgi:hypothetical protein
MRSVVPLVGVIILTGMASAQEPRPKLADVSATREGSHGKRA